MGMASVLYGDMEATTSPRKGEIGIFEAKGMMSSQGMSDRSRR
jgi:hypothetical protein